MDFTCPVATAEIETEKDHELEDLVTFFSHFELEDLVTFSRI